ncbi:MAG: tetratricopeptide repeat protein, partial [Chloroflexi bacterium]
GRVLAAAGKSFAAAGLSEEFLAYAQGIRERLPESLELAHLQIVMSELLDDLPDQEGEAGWALQMTLRLDGLDIATLARAARALGLHLIRVDQVEAAERALAEWLRRLVGQIQRGGVTQAAILAHEWANSLTLLGRPADAIRRYEAALAGYAEAQDAVHSAVAQRDLSKALIQLEEFERAEDVLRRALVTADYTGRCDLAGDIQRRLAGLHRERADDEDHVGQRSIGREEWQRAADYLDDALLNALACGDTGALAGVYLELGRVLAKLGQFNDAVAHAARGKTLMGRAGDSSELATAAITLGQLEMLHGDSVAAENSLHQALDLAAALGDDERLAYAARVLVSIHQIRARRAPTAGLEYRRFTLDQASSARARFIDLGLGEQATAMNNVILALTR